MWCGKKNQKNSKFNIYDCSTSYCIRHRRQNWTQYVFTPHTPIISNINQISIVAPNLVIGSLYRSLGEPVRILWKGSTACNTIHVEDVCRAICHLAKLPEAIGETYNLVDSGQTTQNMVAEIVSSLFGVKHEFLGTVISSLCKVCYYYYEHSWVNVTSYPVFIFD